MEVASVVMGILMLLGVSTSKLKKDDREPHWSRNIVVIVWILAAAALVLVPILKK